jgi:hypothetical protein
VELTSVVTVPGRRKRKAVLLAAAGKKPGQRAIVAKIAVVVSDKMVRGDRMGIDAAHLCPPDSVSNIHRKVSRDELIIHHLDIPSNLRVRHQRRRDEEECHDD